MTIELKNKFNINNVIGCDKYKTAFKNKILIYSFLVASILMFALTMIFIFLYINTEAFNKITYLILIGVCGFSFIGSIYTEIQFFKLHKKYLIFCEEIYNKGEIINAEVLETNAHTTMLRDGNTITSYSVKYKFNYKGQEFIKKSRNCFYEEIILQINTSKQLKICYESDLNEVLYLK